MKLAGSRTGRIALHVTYIVTVRVSWFHVRGIWREVAHTRVKPV